MRGCKAGARAGAGGAAMRAGERDGELVGDGVAAGVGGDVHHREPAVEVVGVLLGGARVHELVRLGEVDDAGEEDLGAEEHLHPVLAAAVVDDAALRVHDPLGRVVGHRGLGRARGGAGAVDVLREGAARADGAGVVDGEHPQAVHVRAGRNVIVLVAELDGAEDVDAGGALVRQVVAGSVCAHHIKVRVFQNGIHTRK